MTYCAGILVREGLVMIADTRTNAGLDNVSTFRKLNVVTTPDRTVALASAGNLSVTQTVLGLLQEGVLNPDTDELETLETAPTMFRAAQVVGRAIRKVHQLDAKALEEANVKFDISFLFGGRIGQAPMRLYMIYAAGNFIECGLDSPFLQVGEHKYGKPILDRVIRPDTSIDDAVKAVLVSMDSTLRSNLSVGMPLDLCVIPVDTMRAQTQRIESDHKEFRQISDSWAASLKTAFMNLPSVKL
jgi:putative proteasome-type protease